MIPFTDFGGDGPLLLFAHANAYPPGAYRQFLTALTAHYHVVAIHHRPLWPDQNPDQLNDWHLFGMDLIRFLDERELQQVVGVGHSLGAVAMMYSAVNRPELFRALVMIEPVFLPPHVLAAFREQPAAARDMPLVTAARKRRHRLPSRQAAFDRYRRKEVFGRLSDEALGIFVQTGWKDTENGEVELVFSREWEAAIYMNVPTDVWDLVGQINHPTLAIRATESDTLFPDPWKLWQERRPDATFIEMEDTTHLAPLEKPNELARIVLGWLGKLESG